MALWTGEGWMSQVEQFNCIQMNVQLTTMSWWCRHLCNVVKCGICYHKVCLSVRPSHLWIMPKRFDMYVCMSENLYPARLKQKSHSCAAVSNKQKRLQCPFEPFSGQVGWAQRGQETVPDPSSSDSETPISECTVGASNNEHRSIWWSKHAPTGVRNERTVRPFSARKWCERCDKRQKI